MTPEIAGQDLHWTGRRLERYRQGCENIGDIQALCQNRGSISGTGWSTCDGNILLLNLYKGIISVVVLQRWSDREPFSYGKVKFIWTQSRKRPSQAGAVVYLIPSRDWRSPLCPTVAHGTMLCDSLARPCESLTSPSELGRHSVSVH